MTSGLHSEIKQTLSSRLLAYRTNLPFTLQQELLAAQTSCGFARLYIEYVSQGRRRIRVHMRTQAPAFSLPTRQWESSSCLGFFFFFTQTHTDKWITCTAHLLHKNKYSQTQTGKEAFWNQRSCDFNDLRILMTKERKFSHVQRSRDDHQNSQTHVTAY